jgi:antitoxin (DNA-binding transcriptional repressor) of toxin-antitoxin stability system
MSVYKVSVREAREKFRRLLDLVQGGDEVVVLRRGVEVAKLVQSHRNRTRLPDLDSLRASVKMAGRPQPGDRQRTPERPVLTYAPLRMLDALHLALPHLRILPFSPLTFPSPESAREWVSRHA